MYSYIPHRPEELPRVDNHQSVSDRLERAWSHALLAVSTAEEEASRWVSRWASLAGWTPEEARRCAQEWAQRLTRHRTELERRVDDGVKSALSRIRLPKREEIQDLEKR